MDIFGKKRKKERSKKKKEKTEDALSKYVELQ